MLKKAVWLLSLSMAIVASTSLRAQDQSQPDPDEITDTLARAKSGPQYWRSLEELTQTEGFFEMLHREEIPVPVSIDEAVSITRRYCGTEAPGFVNGVLSAVARRVGAEEARA